MSVVMEQMVAPKYVRTLMEASLVDVMMVIYWMLMELLVMVCTCTVSYMLQKGKFLW